MPTGTGTAGSTTLNRVDYAQVGLTSRNTLRMIRQLTAQTFEVAIGDHSGSLHYFGINAESNQIDTIFKTLPGPNAKINCLEAYSDLGKSSSAKILLVYGPSMIKGFNKKGKQFFALELNNLTEPIKMFRMHRAPDEIHVIGQYIYNSYLINTEMVNTANAGAGQQSSGKSAYNSVVRSRHYYVCPAQINDFVLMEDRFNRRVIPVLACQDRLMRVLKDSNCHFEVEVCGIPSVMQIVPKHLHPPPPEPPTPAADTKEDASYVFFADEERRRPSGKQTQDVHICYGTMDGKISLVTFQFDRIDKDHHLEPVHHWEVPLDGIKQPITCLIFSETEPEFYIGRSDGSIELWRLNESIRDGQMEQNIDLTVPPIMVDSYNCLESVTNLVPVLVGERSNLLLLCSTFTGLLFGLHQHSQASQLRQLNPNFLMISKDNADRIQALQEECLKLEKQLETERKNYAKHTASSGNQLDVDTNLSVLPFFAINDSFVLHNDASYILMLEVEVAIDVVVLHCDLPLDLIDCERNSAVISFNEPSDQVLVTFRCQSNTNRLEIRLRPVEGQHGTVSIYVVSRITPKSCQTRTYRIQPLSLHKRQYSNTRIEYANTLTLTGAFGLADAHTWLRMCIPEIPEKLSRTLADVESEVFYYVSTMTKSVLITNCGSGIITMTSDNVSTISILKDFITREATSQSVPIEMQVDIADRSLGTMLARLYPKVRALIRSKNRHDLMDALADLQTSDAEIAARLLVDLNLDENHDQEPDVPGTRHDIMIGLDRLYGIITDLFIDYHKLKNSSAITSLVSMAKQKLPQMIDLIESMVMDSFDEVSTATSSSRGPDQIALYPGSPEEHWIEPDYDPDDEFHHGNDLSVRQSVTSEPRALHLSNDPNISLFIDRLFHFWNVTV